MRTLQVVILVVTITALTAVHARPPMANPSHLTSPCRGTVENVTSGSVAVACDKGTGNFVIETGAKILRDGKPILAAQISKGEPIQVTFTVLKGRMVADKIIVGNLSDVSDSGGGKKRKKQ